MDSQFKQRLTGAVILVLLAVLLVPELLTGPKSGAPGPTSSAPAPVEGEGAPLRSYDIDLSDTGPAAAPPPPASPPVAEVPRPATRSTEAASSSAAATSRAEPAPGASAALPAMRGFAVQVGSFASRASADRLAANLERRRFDAFVSPTRSGGRQLFRVRVGPVADRATAQSLAARLKAAGQGGSVVPLP